MSDDAQTPERFAGLRRLMAAAALGVWLVGMAFFGATVVHGGSMEPAIAPGDIVVYRRAVKGIQPGDIVLFEHPEWPHGVVHRVADVLPDGRVRTRGDANPVADREPLDRRRIRGVAAFVLPSGRAVREVVEALS